MCVFLLYVLIILKLCIFPYLHCVLVYTFTFYCHAMFTSFFIVYFVYFDSYNNNNSHNVSSVCDKYVVYCDKMTESGSTWFSLKIAQCLNFAR